MRKIDYKEGRELEKTHVCKECGGGLVTAWHRYQLIDSVNYKGYHVVMCSENKDHNGEVRKGYLNYHEQPQEIKDVLDRKERRRKEQNGNRTNNTRGN